MYVKNYYIPLLTVIMFLSVFSQSWEDDSLIVRQILDTNGLDTVSVDVVAKKSNGRINMLYFYNMPAFHILPITIGELNTLIDLKICKTGLEKVPHEIGNLKVLRIIHLYENKLASLPPEIGNLDSLRGMSINSNELTTIPPEIGNCKKIYMIQMGDNKITRIPDEICDIDSLKDIAADDNLIDYVPECIGYMPVFHAIYLNNNRLKSVPNSLIPFGVDDVELCYNDSLVFTEEQKTAWQVTDYEDYFQKYCPVEIEEGSIHKKSKNSQIHITPYGILLNVDNINHVSCSVYNICGRKIETLINGALPKGTHTIPWNRNYYSSGIYFVRYSIGNYSYSVKAVVK